MEIHFTSSQQVGMEVGAVICHFLKWPFCPTHWNNLYNAELSRCHELYFRDEASIVIDLESDTLHEHSKWHHGWVPVQARIEWIDLLDQHKAAFRTTTLTDFSQDENGIWQFASGHSDERIP